MNNEYKAKYQQIPVIESEYNYYLHLWLQYIKVTHDMPHSESLEAYRYHKELFGHLTIVDNDSYNKAKKQAWDLFLSGVCTIK